MYFYYYVVKLVRYVFQLVYVYFISLSCKKSYLIQNDICNVNASKHRRKPKV